MVIAQEFVGESKTSAALSEDGSLSAAAGASRGWRAALWAAFLPQGYPQSVSPDYLGALEPGLHVVKPGWLECAQQLVAGRQPPHTR